jgi:hypothetical protein
MTILLSPILVGRKDSHKHRTELTGSGHNNNGVFTLSWSGPDPMTYFGLSYTLQQKSHDGTWTTVASGIEALSYEFDAPEEEGTWVYRVQGTDPGHGLTTAWSPESAPVKIDETAPYAPTGRASRAPDYAGGGAWYRNSVEVSFDSNGDPALSDGSEGSGVDEATLTAPQTFSTSGSHTACGTVEDYAGNMSSPGCVTVQVDATPPTLELTCPGMVAIGSAAHARFVASDAYSGLASAASGTVPIDTSTSGSRTISYTAASNVGLQTTKSCTTYVGYYVIVKGPVQKLLVRDGEAVLLTSTAKVSGTSVVKPGGALDVEGAKLSGSLSANGATLLRLCSASIAGKVTVKDGTGPVVIGEDDAGCAANTIAGTSTIKSNTNSVVLEGNTIGANAKVLDDTGGATITNNTIQGSLTVTGNTGTVTDRPNVVHGKSKLQ